MKFTTESTTNVKTLVFENDDYKYRAEVFRTDSEIDKILMGVVKKGERQVSVGSVALKGDTKSVNLNIDEDIILHVTVFQELLTELE